jgi:dephospho-CoA kinase
MIVIGLTGGVATGKTTTADLFRERGIAVHDADATVHGLMAVGGQAVDQICALFGSQVLTPDNSIDRQKLGKMVFQNPEERRQLEEILHPLVAKDRNTFIAQADATGASMVVLDVPLLFETGGHNLCDKVIVTSAPPEVQSKRAMLRPGMTADRINGILNSQMPLAEKIRQADLVLHTENGIDHVRQTLFAWLDQMEQG